MTVLKNIGDKLKQSVIHSMSGLLLCFLSEKSFKIEVLIYIFSIPLGIFLSENIRHFIILNGSIIIIMSFELLNSGLEKTIDEIGQGRVTYRFKYAKDCGSAGVCLAVLLSFALWLEAIISVF